MLLNLVVLHSRFGFIGLILWFILFGPGLLPMPARLNADYRLSELLEAFVCENGASCDENYAYCDLYCCVYHRFLCFRLLILLLFLFPDAR